MGYEETRIRPIKSRDISGRFGHAVQGIMKLGVLVHASGYSRFRCALGNLTQAATLLSPVAVVSSVLPPRAVCPRLSLWLLTQELCEKEPGTVGYMYMMSNDGAKQGTPGHKNFILGTNTLFSALVYLKLKLSFNMKQHYHSLHYIFIQTQNYVIQIILILR